VTPSSGFTGGVAFTLTAPTALTNFSYCVNNATVSGTTPVTATITLYTTTTTCPVAGSRAYSTPLRIQRTTGGGFLAPARVVAGTALASLLLLGFPGRRRRRWPMLGAVLALASLSLAVSGCGSSGGSSSTTSSNSPKGTYTLTLTGTNSTLNLAETTTFTLTVD
jgi:hypothetical protein